MELRQPPNVTTPSARPRGTWLLSVVVLLQLGIGAGVAFIVVGGESKPADHAREVASKLKAAGAAAEAAGMYEKYLEQGAPDIDTRAKIAFSIGEIHLEQGQYERALRWFYEAESLGGGGLGEAIPNKIVHSLERLGRIHAAQAAMAARTQLDADEAVQRAAADPVVAKIGAEAIHRSDVEQALAAMPPQLAKLFGTPQQKQEFVRKYVADELLYRKAHKLQYHEDPEVRRQMDTMYKQLVVGAFVEREVLGKITSDPADLQNFYTANAARYTKEGEQDPQPFEDVSQRVEADYRMMKSQSAYLKMIEEQLASGDVEIFAERMGQ